MCGFNKTLEKLQQKGINSLFDVRVLLSLRRMGGRNITEVAASEKIKIDTARKSLQRLELAGLVKTERTRGSRGYVRKCWLTKSSKSILR